MALQKKTDTELSFVCRSQSKWHSPSFPTPEISLLLFQIKKLIKNATWEHITINLLSKRIQITLSNMKSQESLLDALSQLFFLLYFTHNGLCNLST